MEQEVPRVLPFLHLVLAAGMVAGRMPRPVLLASLYSLPLGPQIVLSTSQEYHTFQLSM